LHKIILKILKKYALGIIIKQAFYNRFHNDFACGAASDPGQTLKTA
jgi:hypothetical protein